MKLTIGKTAPEQPSGKLECLNWPDQFPYKPDVAFRAWHDGKILHLRYEVGEQSVKAEEGTPGNAVFRDSCVEFFIKPSADDPHYYNFEWNAIGTLLLACRTCRQDPENAPREVLDSVKAVSSLGSATFAERKGNVRWTLDIEIPITALWNAGIKSWDGMKAKANFYKCGDGLSVPHYVTWAPVGTEKPDYHRPEFFVPVEFD